jgi:hypothetical protein
MNTETLTWKFADKKPLLILTTIEEALAFIQGPEPKWPVNYQTCCLPILDFLDELEKSGYVYNDPAQRAFEQVHGLEPCATSGTNLSRLVYCAQRYRAARKLEQEGWEPLTREILSQSLAEKKRVHVFGESAFCGNVVEPLKVRVWSKDGQIHAFRGRERTPRKFWGMPCKLLAA